MPISLERMISEFNAALSLEEAVIALVHLVREELPADSCSFYLSDNEKGEYLLAAMTDDQDELVGRVRLKFGESLVGLIADREEPINIPDLHEDPVYKKRSLLDFSSFHGFMGVPIAAKGEAYGALIVKRKAIGKFSQDEQAELATLAIQLANVLTTSDVIQAISRLRKLRTVRLPKRVNGVPGSPGMAIGKAVVLLPPADLDAVPDSECDDPDLEVEHFKQALEQARQDIASLQQTAQQRLSVAEQALFDAYLRILDSRSLSDEIIELIEADNFSAAAALKRVIKKQILQFESLDDPYLRERAVDMRDLGQRVLGHLQGEQDNHIDFPSKTILVSEEVTATQLMSIPAERLQGVVAMTGSSNSHAAILARAMDLPTVMGCSDLPLNDIADKLLVIDGYNGDVHISPGAQVKKEFAALIAEEEALDEELQALRGLPAETTDKHGIQLMINTGLMVDASPSLTVAADGVGLYRTELPFMLRSRFPTEDEQQVMYRQLLNTFAPKPVIMRTLDIGGDKPLPYFHVEEENPFLGWRGIRVALDNPPIFLQQIRAMLRANVGLNNLSIMLPMVSAFNEIDAARTFINQAVDELREEGLDVIMPKLGLMIEVPAAVYQARELAKAVDFLSVGSNDLIQYLLAVDRNNARVAKLYNSYHPAVLRALQEVVDAGHKANRPVSICGEFAADPIGVILLLAMGYDSLSMNAAALLRVKYVIRSLSLKTAKTLLKEVLKMDDAREVQEHMEMALEDAGLAGLIRAGR